MVFKETELKGAFVISLQRLEDERGFFARTFCQNEFKLHGLSTQINQSNISYNKKKGTLRGMHMQAAPHEESKLIKCTRGSIYDVIVDMRESSNTYKQWFGVELTDSNDLMLYIPKGFAHGFITLQDDTDVTYQMNQFYIPGSEKGFRWDDPAFGINWPEPVTVIAKKDLAFPLLNDFRIS